MSTCISKHGEFGSHTFSDRGQPLMCQLCFAFDEEAASDRLRAARWLLAARQLRAALDGREPHDAAPATPAPTHDEAQEGDGMSEKPYTWNDAARDLALMSPLDLHQAGDLIWPLRGTALDPEVALPHLVRLVASPADPVAIGHAIAALIVTTPAPTPAHPSEEADRG